MDHPQDSLGSAVNRDTPFQEMAAAVGLREIRYKAPEGIKLANHVEVADASGTENPRWLAKDESNPYFTYDPAQCIVCNLCVRACDDIQGTFALTISGRGFDSKVSPGTDQLFFDSECVSCGACIQACPTTALEE